jgi:hypothetical protein
LTFSRQPFAAGLPGSLEVAWQPELAIQSRNARAIAAADTDFNIIRLRMAGFAVKRIKCQPAIDREFDQVVCRRCLAKVFGSFFKKTHFLFWAAQSFGRRCERSRMREIPAGMRAGGFAVWAETLRGAASLQPRPTNAPAAHKAVRASGDPICETRF